MCVCVYICMYVCMYVSMFNCMYACIYTFVHMYVCMYVCMYAPAKRSHKKGGGLASTSAARPAALKRKTELEFLLEDI